MNKENITLPIGLFQSGTAYQMMADNINSFKNHLDKFWSSCEFVYSYRAQPFRTGSVK